MRPLLRRSVLGLLVAVPAAAQSEFPPAIRVTGRVLVLNGTGSRLHGISALELYRAALYLEVPARDPDAVLANPGPKFLIARYRREMSLRAVSAAWEESFQIMCACPLPEAFRAWLAPLPAGADERFSFTPDAVLLEGSGRAPLRIADAELARRLLLAWIGPAAPTEMLRRGLLGQA